MFGYRIPFVVAILTAMSRVALIPFVVGVLLPVAALELSESVVTETLALLVYLAIVPVGLAFGVSAGLPRLRARAHPLPSVLAASGFFWLGAFAGHVAAFASDLGVELSLAIVVNDLGWVAGVSGGCVTLVALAMTVAHAARARAAVR
jgi:hypothetical protein